MSMRPIRIGSLMALRVTAVEPWHPLYLPYELEPKPFSYILTEGPQRP